MTASASIWAKRLILAFVAFAGTAAYAYSFTLVNTVNDLSHLALRVGVASGICWPLFGTAILITTGAIKNALVWADICLITMTWGMAVLSIGTILNLLHVSVPTGRHTA